MLALIIFSVSLPALAACYAMGGISLVDHIGPLLLVLFGMAVQYTAVGLWVSALVNSTDASLRWTYAAVLALAVLSIGPTVFVGKLSGIRSLIAHWTTAISPISALQSITGSQAQASEIGISARWPEFLAVSCVITVVLAVITLLRLDPRLLERARPTGKVVGRTIAKKPFEGWVRRVSYLVDPQRTKGSIPWWLNPVMVKEFRTRKFGRLHWLIRLVAVSGIFSLLLTVVAATGTVSWGVERIAPTMVLLQVALLLLLGPCLGANLIASEVESGGWDLLRASPISPLRILIGKLMSTIWTLLLMLLATLPGYLVMVHSAGKEWASWKRSDFAGRRRFHGHNDERLHQCFLSDHGCCNSDQLRGLAFTICRYATDLGCPRQAVWTASGGTGITFESGCWGFGRDEDSRV